MAKINGFGLGAGRPSLAPVTVRTMRQNMHKSTALNNAKVDKNSPLKLLHESRTCSNFSSKLPSGRIRVKPLEVRRAVHVTGSIPRNAVGIKVRKTSLRPRHTHSRRRLMECFIVRSFANFQRTKRMARSYGPAAPPSKMDPSGCLPAMKHKLATYEEVPKL